MLETPLTPRRGHVCEVDTLPECMVCRRPATWDCPILGQSGWANLCSTHVDEFARYGRNTGVGLGQVLILRGKAQP